MRFNPAAFDRWLNSVGQRVAWRRSWQCPCVNQHSGQPDPKHALCSGKGRLWDAPVETVTGVASQKVLARWMESGRWEAGDAILSIPQNSPLWDAGQYDRITMLNGSDVFSVALTHGAPNERLLFKVARVTRCFWLHPTTRLVVEGGIPTVGADGVPVWASGEPPPGATYSLSGEKFSEYFVYDSLSSDRNQHSGMRLPRNLVARKWDLFNR